MANSDIIGRFAPSPTGPLHFGSLVCALASYLDVKSRGGQWLVRVEDIDPPREVAGSSDFILRQLEAHGLHWDSKVLYQSTRLDAYQEVLLELQQRQLAYHCECSRKRLTSINGIYDERCRNLNLNSNGNATRLCLSAESSLINFNDQIVGPIAHDLRLETGDFIIKRRDGLFSYQLAVTVDDQFQGVTHVMRGSDLLDSTPKQIYLQHYLGYRKPTYAHLPIAVNSEGQKLSKQTKANHLMVGNEVNNCWQALYWLKQSPPPDLQHDTLDDLHQWALDNWASNKITRSRSAPAPHGF